MDNETTLQAPLRLRKKIEAVRQMSSAHVAFIVEDERRVGRKIERFNVQFDYMTIHQALYLLDKKKPSAILVSANLENELGRYIDALRTFAKDNSIPLILYTRTFEKLAQNIARTYRFDDYCFGSLVSRNFLSHLSFFRRLKRYKLRHRGNFITKYKHYYQHSKYIAKRTLDVLVASTLLIALSPLMLIIALAIKLESKGPVFYVSKRAGQGYKVFDFYKFRSMRKDADRQLNDLLNHNQYGATFFKMKNDPRITWFGNFLRNTSLDELPQLFNVVKGDMSLVGNRPLPLYEANQLTKDETAWRFLAPAGITGLWQITKRGKDEMSDEERINLDVSYAHQCSLSYDLKILLGTFPALFQKAKV